jgi:mono/diheme cytochrome c family protein
MSFRISCLAILGVWAAALSAPVTGASQAGTTRSIRDGVFTEEQAKRGEASYEENCSECHGRGLRGDMNTYTPPLTTIEFTSKWNGATLGGIFQRIESMHQGEPAKLPPAVKADILAYVLSVNDFSAGSTELAGELDQLNRITFEIEKR